MPTSIMPSTTRQPDLIGAQALFNAVGEVASWLSASDEQLRSLEAVKTSALCLAQISRRPLCKPKSSASPSSAAGRGRCGGVETLMLAPIAFCLTMTSMFLSPAGERSEPATARAMTASARKPMMYPVSGARSAGLSGCSGSF